MTPRLAEHKPRTLFQALCDTAVAGSLRKHHWRIARERLTPFQWSYLLLIVEA